MNPEKFLSTPSVGRATCPVVHNSPHVKNFYPRPPWGGRPEERQGQAKTDRISIHALRGEGDGSRVLLDRDKPNFYPRPPWGGRPELGPAFVSWDLISIHALRGEGDAGCAGIGQRPRLYFYPRPPWGGRPVESACKKYGIEFLSTPSVGRATRAFSIRIAATSEDFYPRPPWGGRPARPHTRGRNLAYFYPRPPWGGRRLTAG